MPVTAPALAYDWLGASRRATEALRGILCAHPTTRERVIETGERGEGGDLTLVIDRAAEDAIFTELEALYEAGARFTAVSEERGTVSFGATDVLVCIDPLDGSLNAKRGLSHHAVSIAVADGPTMADVAFAFVHDFGPGEEWRAERGAGAFLDDVRIDDPPGERRKRDGRLELLALEQTDPRHLARVVQPLAQRAARIRALGSMAVALCQVATTRVDAMASLWRTRAVDVAAAQLVVRESGGVVAFGGCAEPLGAPLDLEPRAPVVAARTQATLDALMEIVA